MPEFQPVHTDVVGISSIQCYECVSSLISVDEFTQHYLLAAEWTDVNSDHDANTAADPESSEYDPTIIGFVAAKGWSKAAVEQAVADCEAFMVKIDGGCEYDDEGRTLYDRYIAAGGTDEQMGHDFWLTRNGHGVGFWDRGLGTIGDDMTKVAQTFRESNVYVDGDALLYLE